MITFCLYSFWKAVLNLSVTTEVYKLDASMSLRSILRPRGGMVSVSDNRIRSGSELSFEMRVSVFPGLSESLKGGRKNDIRHQYIPLRLFSLFRALYEGVPG